MNDPERLAALLDDLHEHAGHGVRLERCLQADCRELWSRLVHSRVIWLDDRQPRRSMFAHGALGGPVSVYGEQP